MEELLLLSPALLTFGPSLFSFAYLPVPLPLLSSSKGTSISTVVSALVVAKEWYRISHLRLTVPRCFSNGHQPLNALPQQPTIPHFTGLPCHCFVPNFERGVSYIWPFISRYIHSTVINSTVFQGQSSCLVERLQGTLPYHQDYQATNTPRPELYQNIFDHNCVQATCSPRAKLPHPVLDSSSSPPHFNVTRCNATKFTLYHQPSNPTIILPAILMSWRTPVAACGKAKAHPIGAVPSRKLGPL